MHRLQNGEVLQPRLPSSASSEARPKHKKECKRRAAELFDEELFKDPPEGPECPVCMLPLPFDGDHIHFGACCGKFICMGCMYAQIKEEILSVKEDEDCGACTFCRTPPTSVEKEILDRLSKGVERNDANSIEQLAVYYMGGEMGLQQDSVKSMELLLKAGEHGCPNAYGSLGIFYCDSLELLRCERVEIFQCKGVEKDKKKAKYYWELGAIGGDAFSRYNLALLEESNGDRIRAGKHFLICAKAGYEQSLQKLKLSFQHGYTTKDEYTGALRAYHKQHEDRKSAMRDEALDFRSSNS